jgi:hypothetical protein
MINYYDYKNMIYSTAWKVTRCFPSIEYDEALGQANLAFVEAKQTYNPKKGEFSTHYFQVCRRVVWKHFSSQCKKIISTEFDEEIHSPSKTSPLFFLKEETLEILKIIFESPAEILGMDKRRRNRYFYKILGKAKAEKAFAEIREVLR